MDEFTLVSKETREDRDMCIWAMITTNSSSQAWCDRENDFHFGKSRRRTKVTLQTRDLLEQISLVTTTDACNPRRHWSTESFGELCEIYSDEISLDWVTIIDGSRRLVVVLEVVSSSEICLANSTYRDCRWTHVCYWLKLPMEARRLFPLDFEHDGWRRAFRQRVVRWNENEDSIDWNRHRVCQDYLPTWSLEIHKRYWS